MFWKKLSGCLEKLGFIANPCVACAMNKTVNGQQMTVGWHVDDLKISHVDSNEIEKIIEQLELEFGKEALLTAHQGNFYDYLGITIDFSDVGKVIFSMHDYFENMLDEAPEDLMKGTCSSPASHHLFKVNKDHEKLDSATAMLFHHIVAQLLYLGKRTRPCLLLAISFLCTRV